MLIVIRVSYIIALAAYLAAAAVYIRSFSSGADGARRRRVAFVLCGMAFQLGGLLAYAVFLRQAPFLGMLQGFVFASFVMAALFLLVYRQLEDERSLGIVVAPMIFAFQMAGVFTPLEYIDDPSLRANPWFVAHASVALFSYGAFGLSFASAVLYLLLHRQLKSKRLGRLFERLPSLGELDYLTYLAVTIGFVALTVSIITGMAWTQVLTGRLLQGDPKEFATLANWLIYALYLHSRLYGTWRGKRSAVLALVGFGMLISNFVLVTVWLSKTHFFL
jgi:ABC-type transport system involved in cytochrome c biogenesis permease subunit